MTQRSYALILPSTFVVSCDSFTYGQPLFQVPLLVRRLAQFLEAQGARVTLIEAPFERDRVLILRGKRPCGPHSGQPEPVAVGHLGLPASSLESRLEQNAPYDEVWITSQFTFDREAIWEAVRLAKRLFPSVPVRLGGVYASLCPEDAAASGADSVHEGLKPEVEQQQTWVAGGRLGLVIVGRGCTRSCSYCGWRFTENTPPYHRNAKEILADFDRLEACGTVFNSLLATNLFHPNGAEEAEAFLSELGQRSIRLALTTAVDPHLLTPRRAALLQRAGVIEASVALQTFSQTLSRDWQRETGVREYLTALQWLKDAGFESTQLYTDVLTGHPQQSLEESVRTACFVWSQGASPLQHPFAIVPRSRDGQRFAAQASTTPLQDLHPLLWPFVGPEHTAHEHLEYFKLGRVLPQLLLRALNYLDPDSYVRRLVLQYLDEFDFSIPQWCAEGQLPGLHGLQPFLSHPWELALALSTQGDRKSMLEILPQCLKIPVVDARYFDVALALLEAGEKSLSHQVILALLPTLQQRDRLEVQEALTTPHYPQGLKRTIAQALQRVGLPDTAAKWQRGEDNKLIESNPS